MGKFCSSCGQEVLPLSIHICQGRILARDANHGAVYCSTCGDRQSRCRWCHAPLRCTHRKRDPLDLSNFCSSCGKGPNDFL